MRFDKWLGMNVSDFSTDFEHGTLVVERLGKKLSRDNVFMFTDPIKSLETETCK